VSAIGGLVAVASLPQAIVLAPFITSPAITGAMHGASLTVNRYMSNPPYSCARNLIRCEMVSQRRDDSKLARAEITRPAWVGLQVVSLHLEQYRGQPRIWS
jgi:hypothetical protein